MVNLWSAPEKVYGESMENECIVHLY
jgi:hypothetical protein